MQVGNALNLCFTEAFDTRGPDAHECLMLDIPRGNPTFPMRRDEVDAAWSWIEPILDAWERVNARHKAYTVGIWGAGTAIAPIARDGRTWHEDIV